MPDRCSPRQALVAPLRARQIPIAPAEPGAPIPRPPSLAAFERRPGRACGCVRAGPASETRHKTGSGDHVPSTPLHPPQADSRGTDPEPRVRYSLDFPRRLLRTPPVNECHEPTLGMEEYQSGIRRCHALPTRSLQTTAGRRSNQQGIGDELGLGLCFRLLGGGDRRGQRLAASLILIHDAAGALDCGRKNESQCQRHGQPAQSSQADLPLAARVLGRQRQDTSQRRDDQPADRCFVASRAHMLGKRCTREPAARSSTSESADSFS